MITRPPKRIALAFNRDRSYWRRVLRGLLRLEQARSEWELHGVKSLTSDHLDRLNRWRPDGIIADIADPEMEKTLARLDIPVIDVSDKRTSGVISGVGVDHVAVGQLAARHLIELGFRDFAYFGDNSWESCRRQLDGFMSEVQQKIPGGTISTPPPLPSLDMSQAWTSADDVLAEWLESIPRPFGMMLGDDEWGLWITQIAHRAGLRVPEDVAIIGVNDDTLHCELASPALSSIQVPLSRIGYESGMLLATLMKDKKIKKQHILLPPLGIAPRQSTSVLAVDDEDLAAAVKFIENASHRPISVDDILDNVPISRRLLERKFREHLGRSPLQEIRIAHLKKAKSLLIETDDTLQDVADHSGFGNMYHLCRVFKRETGETPITYRRKHRFG